MSSLEYEISRSFSLPSVDLDNNYPSILIIGKPNVGKSTLSNSIIGKNKQLIEDSPGTTRDCIKIPVFLLYNITFVLDLSKRAATESL